MFGIIIFILFFQNWSNFQLWIGQNNKQSSRWNNTFILEDLITNAEKKTFFILISFWFSSLIYDWNASESVSPLICNSRNAKDINLHFRLQASLNLEIFKNAFSHFPFYLYIYIYLHFNIIRFKSFQSYGIALLKQNKERYWLRISIVIAVNKKTMLRSDFHFKQSKKNNVMRLLHVL